jgi:thiosulfate dehydrogenase
MAACNITTFGERLMCKAMLACVMLAAASTCALAAPPTNLPPGRFGEDVQRGYDMIVTTQSNAEAKAYVGNSLNCSSCHRDGGTTDTPGNFLTTATKFPSWSAREGATITLEDRIDNCFMRSMHGLRPNPDDQVTVDIAAYLVWLARGKPLYPPKPATAAGAPDFTAMAKMVTHANYAAGQQIYTAKCAACHGVAGTGAGSFPPVWGKASYNAGAGLANVPNLAEWLKGNMPLGNAHLIAQEAVDVAVYVDAQDRAPFVLAEHLPNGIKANEYNATVRAETDTVDSNLRKLGLSLDDIKR